MNKLELQLSRPANVATLIKYDVGLRTGLKKIFGVGFCNVVYVVNRGAMNEYRLSRDNKKLKVIFERILRHDYKKARSIMNFFKNHYDEMRSLVKESGRIVSGLSNSPKKIIEMIKKFDHAYEHVWPGVVFIYWLPLWTDKSSLNKEGRKRLEKILKVRCARDMEYVFAQQFYDNIAVYIHKKFKISRTLLDMGTPSELIKLLKVQGKNNALMNRLAQRLRGYIVFRGHVIPLSSFKQINQHLKKYGVELPKPKRIKKFFVLKGLVAHTGKARGRVSLLKSRKDMTKIVSGDIIISPMTTPYFNQALKKASAIVTDEGGVTCHAAIFARELGIPCIVGTKVATQVLKDGDRVEVDASKGIVIILSSDKKPKDWIKIVARNNYPINWAALFKQIMQGFKKGKLHWTRPANMVIVYNSPLHVFFKTASIIAETNFLDLVETNYTELLKYLQFFKKEIEKDIKAIPAKTKQGLKKLYYRHRMQMGIMVMGIDFSCLAKQQLQKITGEKRFRELEELYNKTFKPTVVERETAEIIRARKLYKKNPKLFSKLAGNIAKKYGYIHSEYKAREWKEEDYESEIKQKFVQAEHKPKRVKLKENEKKLVKIIQFCNYLYDEGKTGVVRTQWAMRKTLKNIGIDEERVMNCGEEEFFEYVETNNLLSKKIVETRNKYFAIYNYRDEYQEITGQKQVKHLIDRENIKEFETPKRTGILKGQPVYPGRVKGRARILFSYKDAEQLEQGEILVVSMTTPEFIAGMRKAKAFVTDEGGITCHAAIVAREMGKTCVTGTKYATKLIKNGDIIEVDANKGIVKKI